MVRDFLERLKHSDKTAVVCGEHELSYRRWNHLSSKLCDESLKNVKGKLVGIFLPNGIAYVVSYFACLYANKVIVPFHTGSTMNELLYTINLCSLSTLVIQEESLKEVEVLIQENRIPMTIVVVNHDGTVCRVVEYFQALFHDEQYGDELQDVVVMLHTSGTTSKPKRVMLTNEGLQNNIKAHSESLNFTENEVCLIQLPMVFGYCNTAQFLTHVYLGARIVINPYPFMAADFFKLVDRWKITNFTVVPSILIALARCKKLSFDISSLRVICFGGSAIPENYLREMIEKYPTISYVQTYGLTEAGPRVTTLPPEYCKEKIGSVGCAIPGVEIKIVDDSGMSLPNGEKGEVIVKSKGMMKGYFRCYEETQAIIHNGWLHTGDLGYISEDNYLYIVGRKKNIIITGGQNVSPEEVEEVISSCNDVKDVKVYGISDDLLGEKVAADIVVVQKTESVIEQVKQECQTKLRKYKIPSEFQIVDTIARTYNGKVKRN